SQSLPPHACKAQEEKKDIAKSDLAERVFEGEPRLSGMRRTQEYAEGDQQQRPPDGMEKHPPERLPFCLAPGNRKRERAADEKRERGLNQIVQRASRPFDV